MSAKDDQERLEMILRGAFAGPPTPLKDITKRNGKARAKRKEERRRRRRKKRAA